MKPLSSRKAITACSSRPLFYARPILASPAVDGKFIPLPGALFRFLTGPVQAAEDLPHVTRMVADAQLALDDVRDALASPQIGAVACVERSSQQNPYQLLSLSAIQSWLATRVRFGVQSLQTTPVDSVLPSLYRGFRRFDNTCNLTDALPFQQELPCNFPPNLPLGWTCGCVHT
jgi:hypothetical protein